MPIVRVGRRRFFYERSGSGDPVLFISGLGSGHSAWNNVVAELHDSFDCITFDNRGAGRSSKPRSGYGMPDLLQDSLGVLDALAIPSAHVVGQSMGGMVGQMMAAHHPNRVRRLVLVSSLATSYPLLCHILRARRLLRRRLKPYEYALVSSAWFLSDQAISRPGFLEAHARRQAENPYPQASRAFDQLVDSICGTDFDSRPWIAAIRQPTLVVHGEQDALVRPSEGRYLAEHIPHAELAMVAGVGHAVVVEDPKGFAAQLARFLSAEGGANSGRS